MKRTNLSIQALRGVFCLFIAIAHFTSVYARKYGMELPALCSAVADDLLTLGMFGFCLISGYFLISPAKKDRSVPQSFVHKFFRLYPSYLISIVLIFLVLLLAPDPLVEGLRKPFPALAQNALLINLPLRTGFIDGAHWYVPFLLFFTLYFTLLSKAKQALFSKAYWLISHAALILISLGAMRYLPGALQYLAYSSLLSFGVFLRMDGEKPFERWAFAAVSCLELVEVLMITLVQLPNQLPFYILIVPFVAFVYFTLKGKVTLVGKEGALTWLGDRSYNIYLIHQFIGFVIINFFIASGLPYVLGIIVAIVVAILLGSGIYFVDSAYIGKATRAIESRIWPD